MQATSKDLIKYALFLGWYEVSQEGSHKQYKHGTLKGKITIPHPKKNIPEGTIRSVLKQLSKTKEEFEKWKNG